MDSGLEEFIAARRAEGFDYVVLTDAACIGWGHSADEAWDAARQTDPEAVLDAQCFDSAPNGRKIDRWVDYAARSGDTP